jgi:hypothetical protein
MKTYEYGYEIFPRPQENPLDVYRENLRIFDDNFWRYDIFQRGNWDITNSWYYNQIN